MIQPGLEFALLDQESSALTIRSPSLPCQHIQLGNIEQSDHNAILETNFVSRLLQIIKQREIKIKKYIKTNLFLS